MNEEIDRIRKEFNFTNDKFIDEIHGSIRLDMSFVKDFKKLLNYIDKLQKRIMFLREENTELIAYKNKLINYIAITENKTREEVYKEFDI